MLRRLEAPRVLSNLDIGERSVCLDIGCGSGIGALLINQYLDCEKVVGIDVDPDMVNVAEEYVSHPPKWAQNIRTDNIEFLYEDAPGATLPDCYFDAVFLFGVLHHIRGWKKAISEVHRMLEGEAYSLFLKKPYCLIFSSVLGNPDLTPATNFLGTRQSVREN